MFNPKTEKDDAKYCAVLVVMAEHMEPGAERAHYRSLTLKRLAKAVRREDRLRGSCRDTDVVAATRVRDWLASS